MLLGVVSYGVLRIRTPRGLLYPRTVIYTPGGYLGQIPIPSFRGRLSTCAETPLCRRGRTCALVGRLILWGSVLSYRCRPAFMARGHALGRIYPLHVYLHYAWVAVSIETVAHRAVCAGRCRGEWLSMESAIIVV
ncbi:hypothetical protein A8926_5924 [Saccharopolyspora spinosa]|uniref:Uncharacterized protein n=1 Tax=Saccharopolyspora spinosa TaxID=60894 RepID=A0A2N3Y4R5_SACSN|nr:hypothetical protein A8926_5924 [Saccharopolyspora spinosa]